MKSDLTPTFVRSVSLWRSLKWSEYFSLNGVEVLKSWKMWYLISNFSHRPKSTNDVNKIYCLIWKPFKIRKTALYRFLIPLLVQELLRFKDLKTIEIMVQVTAWSWVKSIKIDKICDVISWTSSSKQSLNMLFYSKYFFKLFERLAAETARHYAECLWKKLIAIVIMLVSDSFDGFHQMKYNAAITCQNQLEFLHQKVKDDFS